MTRYLLTCTKTGRYWRYVGERAAYRAALTLGLKDYTLEDYQ